MTYTNPWHDMFERDRNRAYWERTSKKAEATKSEEWNPEDEDIII